MHKLRTRHEFHTGHSIILEIYYYTLYYVELLL